MSVPRHSVPPSKDADLEVTAELPVLDVAAYEAALGDERATSTDTWHMPALQIPSATAPAQPLADNRSLQLEIDLRALSANLKDVEERLTRKGERLAELERELAGARGERIAIEDRAAQQISEAHKRADDLVREAEERAAAVARSTEERAAAVARAAEERAATLGSDLSDLRTQLADEQTRAATLQSSVTNFETQVRAHETRDYERAKLLAVRDEELGLARRDLRELEVRAANYLESLQSLEGRRVIFDGQLLGLDGEIAQRDTQNAQLHGQLAAETGRARDLALQLSERTQRVAELEREVASLASSLGQRNVEAEQSDRTKSKLQESVNSLSETLAARVERIRALEAAASNHSDTLVDRQRDVERLTKERDALLAKAATLETSLAGANAGLSEKDGGLQAAAEARADLEKRLAAAQGRGETLDRDLTVARAEIAERSAAMLRVEAERDDQVKRLADSEARALEVERRGDEYQDNIRQLQDELRTSSARTTELEGDLRAAEELLNRLESELRTKNTKLEELTKSHEEWRGTIESARQSLAERESLINRLETEAANSAALLGNIRQSIKKLDPNAESGQHEIAPEGAVRLLIRADGDTEVVHVLGRKTTVGRTPDNDLQIDAKFISRNHAVILAGPNHTIIEDLNSTNGVAVNGRRISRHTLRDGDTVAIGKTTFRFAVRSTDRRQ